uniref:Transmembrane protein n=1 Tax=Odontella aurita TaxID=265563 RepID=A0A7S4K3A9_9STRA|mmetsp:Transcript_60624/g.179755  ORF Transcript_60624/g.179755 Transcript_60624/m.179755 type:complete len:396 (+) Transcript_60624:63-1250(+)
MTRTERADEGRQSLIAHPPIPFRSLLGPFTVFASSLALAFPILVGASAYTLGCFVTLSIGIAVTIVEGCSRIHGGLRTIQRGVCQRLRETSLDDALKSVFSFEYGAIPCAISGFNGAVGFCNLPMTDEQRARLFQWAFDIEHENDAREALTAPGGFLRLLPDSWNKSLRLSDGLTDASSGQSKESMIENETLASADLSWDGDDESHSISDSTDVNPPNGPKENRYHTHVLSVSAPLPKTDCSDMNDSVKVEEVLRSILDDIIAAISRKALSHVDEQPVRFTGIAATSALLLQLWSSNTARKMMRGALHASATIGLAGVAAGAFALSEMKRRGEVSEHRNATAESHNRSMISFSTMQMRNLGLLLRNKRFRQRMQMTIALFVVTNIGKKWRHRRRK